MDSQPALRRAERVTVQVVGAHPCRIEIRPARHGTAAVLDSQTAGSAILRRGPDLMVVSIDDKGLTNARPLAS